MKVAVILGGASYEREVSLPIFPNLKAIDQKRIIEIIKKLLR